MNFQFQTQRLYLKKRSPMILSKSIYTDTKFKMSQWKPYDPPYSNCAFQIKPSDLQIQTIQNYQSTFSFSKILLQKGKDLFKKIQFTDIFQKFKVLKDKFWSQQNTEENLKLDYSSDTGKITSIQEEEESLKQEILPQIQTRLQKRRQFQSNQLQNQKKIQKLNSGISLFVDDSTFDQISDNEEEEKLQENGQKNDRRYLKIKRKTLKHEDYVNKVRIIKPLNDEFKKPKRKDKASYGDVKKIFEQNGIKEAYKNETDDDFDEFISQKSNIQNVYQSDTLSFISDLRKLNQQSQKNHLKIPKQTKSCTYSEYKQDSSKSLEVIDNQDSSSNAHSDCQYNQAKVLDKQRDFDLKKKDKNSSLDQDSQQETDNEHEQYQKKSQKTMQQSPPMVQPQNVIEKQEPQPNIEPIEQKIDTIQDVQKPPPTLDTSNPFLQKQNNISNSFEVFINSNNNKMFLNTVQPVPVEQKPTIFSNTLLNMNNNNDKFQIGQQLQSGGLFGKLNGTDKPNFLNDLTLAPTSLFQNNQQKVEIIPQNSLFTTIQNNSNFNSYQQQNSFQIPQPQSLYQPQPSMFPQNPSAEQKPATLFGNLNSNLFSTSNINPFISQNKEMPIQQNSGLLFDNSNNLKNDSQQSKNNKKQKIKQRIQG